MNDSGEIVVHGRCACGKRYRIRHARAGVSVGCPHCDRPIPVTEADLRAAFMGESLKPVQDDARLSYPDAILVDFGELSIASEGARVGLTGREFYDNPESLLFNAQTAGRPALRYGDAVGDGRGWAPAWMFDSGPAPERSFIENLWASFWLAGIPSNFVNMCISIGVCASLSVGLVLLGSGSGSIILFALTFVLCVPMLFSFAWLLKFYSGLSLDTARGEDGLPWTVADWNFGEDVLRPLVGIVITGAMCFGPGVLLGVVLGRVNPAASGAAILVFGVGMFVWPAATLGTFVGNSLAHLRPDIIIRTIERAGPMYVLVCAVCAVALAAWAILMVAVAQMITQPGASPYLAPGVFAFANVYCGYVLFRTIGLIYRYCGKSLPWAI